MKIGMIGMGFVGGTTARVLQKAHEIFSYDRYKAPYNTKQSIEDLAINSEVVFVCVPTPMQLSGEIDYEPMHNSLNLLSETARNFGRQTKDILVTVRSTAVSGTTDSFAEKYSFFKFAFNPEFLREKSALEDMTNTNRIVLGVEDRESEIKLRSVYKPIFPNAKVIVTNRKTAEMVKYAANATLAAQVMIANDLYRICETIGVDYNSMIAIVQEDERIGRNMQVPGHDGQLGLGGKCFPKDIMALIHLARQHGIGLHVLEEVWRSNLEVREKNDWLEIPGAVSENKNFPAN